MRKRKEEREREILSYRKKVKLIVYFFYETYDINFSYTRSYIYSCIISTKIFRKKKTILRFRIFLFKFICDVCFCTSDLLCVNTRTCKKSALNIYFVFTSRQYIRIRYIKIPGNRLFTRIHVIMYI